MKNKAAVILKKGCFDNIDSAVIISKCKQGSAKLSALMTTVLMMTLLTLLMKTAESMLSKRPFLRICVDLIFLRRGYYIVRN